MNRFLLPLAAVVAFTAVAFARGLRPGPCGQEAIRS
jgi:hypothetical protein